MKVISLAPDKSFIETQYPLPEVIPGNVLVKIKATAFNPIDYQMRNGFTEAKLLKSTILGREFSGVIVETAGDVKKFKVQDHVLGYAGSLGSNGTFAEYVSVPQELIALKPETISFEQASAVPLVGLTALQCLKRIILKDTKNIFISGGAGGVGAFLIRLLLLKGFSQIITTAGNDKSIASLVDLGLKRENILNYRTQDLRTIITSDFDVVVDLVGGQMSELLADRLITNGTFLDVANLQTDISREILFDKGASVLNISNYAYALQRDPELNKIYHLWLKELCEYLSTGSLNPSAINVIGNLSAQTVETGLNMLEKNLAHGQKLIMTI